MYLVFWVQIAAVLGTHGYVTPSLWPAGPAATLAGQGHSPVQRQQLARERGIPSTASAAATIPLAREGEMERRYTYNRL